jgi:type IV secretory pathway protease TraF
MADLPARRPRCTELPRRLLAFSSAGRSAWACAALALVTGSAVCATIEWRPRPALLWNASPSSAVGLYAVSSADGLRPGDMAVAWAPSAARRLAASRRYLPLGVPLVKPVAAVARDHICARGKRIFVNGRVVAVRRSRDPGGRPMPWWSGCRQLQPGELFLLSRGRPDAFDGRYFGVTRAIELVGRARLLWAKPAQGSRRG